jgi:galactitol-specific phosphotransferase system IIB component
MKFTLTSQNISVDIEKIKLDELGGFYSFSDMIVLTSAVICILKMKLRKGVILLTRL